MSDSSPWTVTISGDVAAGYYQTVCVSCTNAALTQTIDPLVIHQKRDCSLNQLTASAPSH